VVGIVPEPLSLPKAEILAEKIVQWSDGIKIPATGKIQKILQGNELELRGF